ncbi:hypothetical protein ACFWN5_37660 [Streptomyces sp. NPDC058430]|uniref:hypothetical protein n=1 Tax=Streptomyces sp. NPDC058430 TaxID=3346495 RepID=UPI00366027BA
MRVRAAAAITAVLLAALTACGGSDDQADDKPAADKTSTKKVDCTDENLSQADWMAHCSDEQPAGGDSAGAEQGIGAGAGEDGKAGAGKLAWGKPAGTTGDQVDTGGGTLEVTPTTITYQAKAMGSTSVNGLFAIITVKDKAVGNSAAAESAPAGGGGWQWIAPDGQALDEGENEASSITPQGFTGGGKVQAGSWAWRTIAFDISKEQQGGTLVYVDGAGQSFRWKTPAKEIGPELAALKKGMSGNY